MDIVEDGDCTFTFADFGCTVVEGQLHVPPALFLLLRRGQLRTAEEFLSYVDTGPTGLALELHWTLAQVVLARAKLAVLLRGFVSDEYLDPPLRNPMRSYGVNPRSK